MRGEKHKIILVSLLRYRSCEPWWSKALFLLFEHNFRFFHFIVQSWQQSRPVYWLATLWLLRPDSCRQRCPAACEMEGCKDSASQVWYPWKKHAQDHQAVHAIHRFCHPSKGDILTLIFIAFSSLEYLSEAVFNRLPSLTLSSLSVRTRGEAPYLCTLIHSQFMGR